MQWSLPIKIILYISRIPTKFKHVVMAQIKNGHSLAVAEASNIFFLSVQVSKQSHVQLESSLFIYRCAMPKLARCNVQVQSVLYTKIPTVYWGEHSKFNLMYLISFIRFTNSYVDSVIREHLNILWLKPTPLNNAQSSPSWFWVSSLVRFSKFVSIKESDDINIQKIYNISPRIWLIIIM